MTDDPRTDESLRASLPPVQPQALTSAHGMPKWLTPILHGVGYTLMGVAGAYGGVSSAVPADAEDVAAMEEEVRAEIAEMRSEMRDLTAAFTELRVSIAARTGQDPTRPQP